MNYVMNRAPFCHGGHPHVAVQVMDGKIEIYRVETDGESAGLEMFAGYLSARDKGGAVKARAVEALAAAKLASGVVALLHMPGAWAGMTTKRFSLAVGTREAWHFRGARFVDRANATKFAVVHRSTKFANRWQVSYFDVDGAVGDTVRETAAAAVAEVCAYTYDLAEVV